jgi:hypothetical protein
LELFLDASGAEAAEAVGQGVVGQVFLDDQPSEGNRDEG